MMDPPEKRLRAMDPATKPGLSLNNFRRVCENGFGDGHNSFAHSMAWFKDQLYIGTTRSNFQMIKIQTTFQNPAHIPGSRYLGHHPGPRFHR